MTQEEQQQFLEDLVKKKRDPSFLTIMYHHLSGDEDMISPKLLDLLMIDESLLNNDGKRAINYLESKDDSANELLSFQAFKWRVMAFLSVQDLLTTPLFSDTTNASMIQIKYFYYESKYVLMEIIAASLNGLHIGNKQLLRNFLEFNLLQCYFINKIKNEQSFKSFNEYLKLRRNPSMHNLIKHAIPNDSFCKPIKKRTQMEMDNLSNRYSHAYDQGESPKIDGIFRPGFSIESLYFYIQVSATLDLVLWIYYVNFPMLFFPVDITKKFGFSPPALFVTPNATAILKKCMSQKDFQIFQDYARDRQEVKDLLAWYNSLPDLTESEIWETVSSNNERKEADTIESYYVKTIVTIRAYSELIIEDEKTREERIATFHRVSDNIDTLLQFSKWQKAYKKAK